MRAKATKAIAAQNMARRAERLLAGLEGERQQDKVAAIRFPAPAPCGRTPLTAAELSKSFGSLEVFTDVDLAVDIVPLLRIPQSAHQLFEGFAMFRCIFEPSEEVERFAKLPTVVQAPGNGRQVFQADADVARLFLEDGTALVLS